jgi:hypothetical protein
VDKAATSGSNRRGRRDVLIEGKGLMGISTRKRASLGLEAAREEITAKEAKLREGRSVDGAGTPRPGYPRQDCVASRRRENIFSAKAERLRAESVPCDSILILDDLTAMSVRYDKAQRRMVISLIAGGLFFVMLASQLGGGANTGGVFPAPLLIVGLLGLPVCLLVFLVSVIQVFLYRRDR